MKTRVIGLAVVIATALGLAVAGWRMTAPSREPAAPVSAPAPAAAPSRPSGPDLEQELAGEIFGVPVSMGNYYFAHRVAHMFPQPWGVNNLPEDQQDAKIWENLVLHYEAFQRGITVPRDEIEKMIDDLLRNHEVSFNRVDNPEAYATWVKETAGEDVRLFENQMEYLIVLQKVRDAIQAEQQVTVTEEELQQEFLNEQHHVGGEMITFISKDEADLFYAAFRESAAWESMKAGGLYNVRPVSLMTLEAYKDLWGIPHEQIYAFHALEIGSVGEPMPFGRQWCVYRLLNKRVGDLTNFPDQRHNYVKQVEGRKKYQAMLKAVEDLKARAHIKIFL